MTTNRQTSESASFSRHVAVAGPALDQPLAQLRAAEDGEPLPATSGTLVWQLAHDLARTGRHVSVVTLDSTVTELTSRDGASLPVLVGPYRSKHRMRDLMRAERTAVRDGILRLHPDLVHAHWCYEYALGALASGVPTLVTVHDWIPAVLRHMDPHYWPYWSGRAVMYARTLSTARHLTANSPYMAEKVKRFARGAVEVVPNGFPDADFADDDTQPGGDVRRAHAPTFISVNNGFSPRKNVEVLLEAFSALRGRQPDVELHLAGDGYEPDGACERWASERGLSDHVRFLGRVPRPSLIHSLDDYVALVHPSKEESFGMTLIEAMARRVPVIGGASSGAVPWVLAAGRAGVLIDVNDPRDIAIAMEALLVDGELHRELAEAGYRHARRNFSQSRVTAMYLGAYTRVLEEEDGQEDDRT